MGSVCVCLGEGNLLLLTSTSVLPCKAVRAAEATVSHSHIWHQSSESSTEAQAEDRRSSKKHEKVYVRTGLEQLSAITTECLEVRPPTLFLKTWSLTLNWKIYDYFSNLWIVESVCQTNFLFWCISYESTLEYAKLLHRSPAIPLLKQNLRYFYCHHTYCRLHSLFYLHLAPQVTLYLHSNSCYCNHKALPCCFRTVRQVRHPCCSQADFYSEGHYSQSWVSQNVSGSPSVTLWSICIQPNVCAEKTNWK